MARKHTSDQTRQLLEASALGLMFPLAIAIGFAWGYWLDRLFGTKPWLTAVFTFLGVVAAFLNLFRLSSGGDGSKESTDETAKRG